MTQEIVGLVRALTHWEAAGTPPSRTLSPKDWSAVPAVSVTIQQRDFLHVRESCLPRIGEELPEPVTRFFPGLFSRAAGV